MSSSSSSVRRPAINMPQNTTTEKGAEYTKDEYEEDILPIEEFKENIIDMIKKNQVLICISETGSGNVNAKISILTSFMHGGSFSCLYR